MAEGPFAFLFTLVMFLIVLGLRRPGWWPWAVAGLVLGLAILTRSAGQVVLFIVPPMILLVERSWRAALCKSALMFAVCAVVTVPWMLRNQAVHGVVHDGRRGRPEPRHLRGDHPPGRLLVRRAAGDRRRRRSEDGVRPEADQAEHAGQDGAAEEQRDRPRPSSPTSATRRRCPSAQTDKAMQEIAIRAILARPLVYVRDVVQNVFSIFMSDTSKVDESLEYHWTLWDKVGWRGEFRRVRRASDAGAGGRISVPGHAGQHLSARAHGRGTAGIVRRRDRAGALDAPLATGPGARARHARRDRHSRRDGRARCRATASRSSR